MNATAQAITPWQPIPGGRYFEPAHEYQDENSRQVPSVTQILQAGGLVDFSGVPAYILERAADLGSAVHLACELYDRDELAGASDTVAPYLLAYEKFKRERKFTPQLIEHRMVAKAEENEFGMCVDRTGDVDGMPVVLDLKTSKTLQKACGIQLAAYALGIGKQGSLRAIVQLAADGSYKFIQYDQESDFAIFRAALKIAHWKLENRVKLK